MPEIIYLRQNHIKMYNRGTLEEFNSWHEMVKTYEGLPKFGYLTGITAPLNQQTSFYSSAIKNPAGGDDYIWEYGIYPNNQKPALTISEVKEYGWFIDNG